jgi:hypothetical protein
MPPRDYTAEKGKFWLQCKTFRPHFVLRSLIIMLFSTLLTCDLLSRSQETTRLRGVGSPVFTCIHLYGHRLMLAVVGVGSLTAYLNPQLVAILERVGWWGIHYRLRQTIPPSDSVLFLRVGHVFLLYYLYSVLQQQGFVILLRRFIFQRYYKLRKFPASVGGVSKWNQLKECHYTSAVSVSDASEFYMCCLFELQPRSQLSCGSTMWKERKDNVEKPSYMVNNW